MALPLALLLLPLFAYSHSFSLDWEGDLTQEMALEIGKKIWKNECAGSFDRLVFWNPHEDCISLGIGHFIWYPEHAEKKFDAMFPRYLAFLNKKKVPIPDILANASDAPWKTREEFLSDEKREDLILLKKWLSETIDLQVEFIITRLSISLNHILNQAPMEEQSRLTHSIKNLMKTPSGLFALIDYLNFKGDGLDSNERYEGKGWGLYQVLLGMKEISGQSPPEQFKTSAIAALTARVHLAPKEKNESRWLSGWKNRIYRY